MAEAASHCIRGLHARHCIVVPVGEVWYVKFDDRGLRNSRLRIDPSRSVAPGAPNGYKDVFLFVSVYPVTKHEEPEPLLTLEAEFAEAHDPPSEEAILDI